MDYYQCFCGKLCWCRLCDEQQVYTDQQPENMNNLVNNKEILCFLPKQNMILGIWYVCKVQSCQELLYTSCTKVSSRELIKAKWSAVLNRKWNGTVYPGVFVLVVSWLKRGEAGAGIVGTWCWMTNYHRLEWSGGGARWWTWSNIISGDSCSITKLDQQ